MTDNEIQRAVDQSRRSSFGNTIATVIPCTAMNETFDRLTARRRHARFGGFSLDARAYGVRLNDSILAARGITTDERMFYGVNLLRGSVPRSGFIGYFENWTGRDIHDAHEGLKQLGLVSVLSLLQEAQTIVLGNRVLQYDATPIQLFPDSLTEKEYEETSEQLDAALKPLETRCVTLTPTFGRRYVSSLNYNNSSHGANIYMAPLCQRSAPRTR